MSRNLVLISLLLSLLGACSSTRIGGIGPHRIDVQQGNALDQESVAKLKPGLSRSQVRFLLGTPLLVDPFHPNRWDYVYMFHKAGKLTEQKRITLFFDNDTLQRIEGDVPAVATAEPIAQTSSPVASAASAASTTLPGNAKAESTPVEIATKPEPVVASRPGPAVPATTPAPLVQPAPVSAAISATPASGSSAAQTSVSASQASSATVAASTSIVAPLAGSGTPGTPAVQRSASDLQLNKETNIARVQPDVIPVFPDPNAVPPASPTPESVLNALKAWSDAWAQGNAEAYIAAYAADYVPAGGRTRAAWEKRRRSLLNIAKNVELRIDTPKVKMLPDGDALVNFKQHYRSANVREDLVKEIRFALREGRWVIVEERVISTLQAPKL